MFKYDVTGGRYEETDYFAQGSGGKDARDSLKKRFKRDMAREDALRVAIEALIDAADEDLGTGGPDLLRGILPSVKTHHPLRLRRRARGGDPAPLRSRSQRPRSAVSRMSPVRFEGL